MDSEQHLIMTKENGVATIKFNRPQKLNALTFGVYHQIAEFARAAGEDDSVRVVVLTGEGRAFCAGGDVHEIIGVLLREDTKGVLEFTRLTGEATKAIATLKKPVIASVNGITAGAGAVLALACDIRLVAESARFAFLFRQVGLGGPDMGSAYLLPRVVGFGKAAELLYTGEMINAQEALRIGLANRVVPDADLPKATAELAARIASGPAMGIRMTKELLEKESRMDLVAAIEMEAEAQALCMLTPDFQEGYKAFLEKREPVFGGVDSTSHKSTLR